VNITKDNKAELFFKPPVHPDTGKAFPFGICCAPNGDLYLADLQWFAEKKPNYKSRVLHLKVKDGKVTDVTTLASGMVVANAVIIRDGYLYTSDTMMIPDSKPLVSGIFRFKLDQEGVEVKKPIENDPHMITTIKSFNDKIPFGADGLTFDSKGNLYCGNFADGTLHRIEFDADGKVKSNTIFAKSPIMKCCDGIFCDLKTDKIYVADSIANAVQIVSPDGKVETLAQDPDNDGSGGRLDQPCEVLLRGNEVVVSNMDFPIATGVNTKFDKPYTLSVIKLD